MNIFLIIFIVFINITFGYGKFSKKIIGGSIADNREFEFQISLRYKGQHVCGGAIIDSKHILTVAHCILRCPIAPIDTNNFEVLVESNFITNNNYGQLIKICRIYIHKNYDSTQAIKYRYDIAMLTLSTTIEFNSRIKPISLPKNNIPDNSKVTVSGWGSPNCGAIRPTFYLKKLELNTISNIHCTKLHKTFLYNENVCTLHEFGWSCSWGDSGNALIANNELVGLLSMGIPQLPKIPDIYIRIYEFLPWIKNVYKHIKTSGKERCQRFTPIKL